MRSIPASCWAINRLHRGAEAGPAAGLVAPLVRTHPGSGRKLLFRRHPCALHQGLDGGRGPPCC